MNGTALFWALLNAGLCALDFAMFASTGSPFSLAAAVVCGFFALFIALDGMER